MTKTWDGTKLKQCKCGADNWNYIGDEDHDDGVCEVFKCAACGQRIHIELPD